MDISRKCTSVSTRKNRSKRRKKINKISFKCIECDATFSLKCNCIRHMKSIHGIAYAQPPVHRNQIEIAKEVFVPDVQAGPSNERSSDSWSYQLYGIAMETAENAEYCNDGGINSSKKNLPTRLKRGVDGLAKTTLTDTTRGDNDHLYAEAANTTKNYYRGSKTEHIKNSSGNGQMISFVLISSDEELEDNSCEEELGNEINILLKMEQDFYKLISLPQPEKDTAISRWCATIKKIFETWHLEIWTVFILFDFPAFRVVTDREIERANNVKNLNETTPQSLLREVVTSHSQAEVLLQLSYEFSELDSSEDFDSTFDSFYKKCRKITDIWGLTESVSYSVLSKMFNIF